MKIEKVAVAVDFSRPSLLASDWTAKHFAPKAEIVLIHCVDVPTPPSFLRSGFPQLEAVVETARTGARERLSEIGRGLGHSKVSIEVAEGRPHACISEVVARIAADVLVVAEHGQRRGLGKLLGSVPERLLRHCTKTPLLIARPVEAQPPGRILVPIDDSEPAERALDWARFLGEHFAAEVIVIHVVTEWYATQVRRIGSEAQAREMQLGLVQRAETWVQERVDTAGFEKPPVSIQVRSGAPDLEVLAAIDAYQADLVVLGSRGAGGVAIPFLGSVTQMIVRNASCSTLVVH